MADFVTTNINSDQPVVRFFHCKSSKQTAGARQKDFYDVLGQAMRTSPWFDVQRLAQRIRHRLNGNARRLHRGGEAELRWLSDPAIRARVQFEVYVVQPGLRRADVTPQILELFGGVAGYLHDGGVQRFGILAT